MGLLRCGTGVAGGTGVAVRLASPWGQLDRAIADRWGRLAATAAAARSPLPVIDGLLAATALDHNLTLVTRNTQDVRVTGVPTFNPWSP